MGSEHDVERPGCTNIRAPSPGWSEVGDGSVP